MNKQTLIRLATLFRSGLIACGMLFLLPEYTLAVPVSTGANPYKAHVAPEKGNLAIFGYDPVAYFIEGRAVKGRAEFEHEFEDARWRFSSAQNREAFVDEPGRYAPQYGGFCAVCIVEDEDLFDANPRIWTIVKGRLYLNNDSRSREKFRRNSRQYIEWANQLWAKLSKTPQVGISQDRDETRSVRSIAIFPFAVDNDNSPVSGLAMSETSDAIKAWISARQGYRLGYAFDATQSNQEVISQEDAWIGDAIVRRPGFEVASSRAERIGVDSVIMAFLRAPPGWEDTSQFGVDLYLIEPGKNAQHKASGKLPDVAGMLDKLFVTSRQSRSVKMAIFPINVFLASMEQKTDIEVRIKKELRAYLDADASLVVVYDYQHVPSAGDDETAVPLWTDHPVSRTPLTDTVSRLAAERGVQAVVTAAATGSGDFYSGTRQAFVDLFVVDPIRKVAHKESGRIEELEQLLSTALAKYRSAGK